MNLNKDILNKNNEIKELRGSNSNEIKNEINNYFKKE